MLMCGDHTRRLLIVLVMAGSRVVVYCRTTRGIS